MGSPSVTLPVPADLPRLLRRLAREERTERSELARLEARLRRFEDVERPAYDAWLRLELGPVVSEIEELAAALRARQMLAERVTELVEDEGLHPREALWVLRESGAADGERSRGAASREEREARHRDEVDARRRAKLERKRAERKRVKRERYGRSSAERDTSAPAARDGGSAEPAGRRLVALYRALARSLHPDSPTVVRALAPARLRAVWAEVQAAYAMRSLERLLALATWLEAVATSGVDADAEGAGGRAEPRGAAEATAGGFLSLAERHERLRALRRAARALDRRLEGLAGEPAWDFPTAPPPFRRKLKQAAARRLAGERDAMRDALAAVDDFLADIGPPRPPGARRTRSRR